MNLIDRILRQEWDDNPNSWPRRHPVLCTLLWLLLFVLIVAVLSVFVPRATQAGAPSPPTSPSFANPTRLTWPAPTLDVTGAPVTIAGYNVYQAATCELAGKNWSSGGVPTYQALQTNALEIPKLEPGAYAWTITAYAQDSATSWPESQNSACVTKTITAASLPTSSDLLGRELAFVSGSASGTKPVFERTAAGAKSTKAIGDLAVGTTTQSSPPFARVKCDPNDSIGASTKYYRIRDSRAPAALKDGYVSGCVSVGAQ